MSPHKTPLEGVSFHGVPSSAEIWQLKPQNEGEVLAMPWYWQLWLHPRRHPERRMRALPRAGWKRAMSVVQNVLETFCLEKLESKQQKGFGSQEPLQTLSVGREELILSCYQHGPLQVKFVFLGTRKSNWNNGWNRHFARKDFVSS